MGKDTVKDIRIALVGSKQYTNRRKIKDFIFKIKQKYGDSAIIISSGGGRAPNLVAEGRIGIGAEGYVKKYTLEFGLRYEEYPPCHYVWDIYCPLHEKNYGKPIRYNKEGKPILGPNFKKKNLQIAAKASHIVMFVPRGIVWPEEKSIRQYAKKFDKKIIRIE